MTTKMPKNTTAETPQPAANTARDGNIAIREEFDRATEIDTAAGWELFLARHPGHPLAEQAAARLRRLTETR